MANTIKLKRGSGSDPSASDLSVGEVAVRTDEGKLFTKKDDGTVAEISGGGGGGATGGGNDKIFYENDQAVTTDYTITSGKNAMSAGPITINNGVSVTVPSGSTYTIV
jgi:hypothetical protein|tara:strand:+ start:184 stop:507 length:324 start_codon:yes stop_codon:yes gene_type:complete